MQPLQRLHQALGEHQQRCLLEVRDQEQQKVLVAELRQHAALAVGEEGRLRIAHHHQRVAAAQVAGVGRGAGARPEAVVAVAALEIRQMRFAIGQGVAAAVAHRLRRARPRAGHQAEPDEIVARQRLRVVEGEIGRQRHAVIFDLAVTQRAGLLRVGAHQRLHQPRPVRRDARRPVAAHMRHEGLALVRVGAGQHRAVAPDQLRHREAVQRAAVRVPARRVGAADAVHQLLHLGQRQAAAGHLDVEDHHVDVEEEIQMHMDDIQRHRRVAIAGSDTHLGDIATAEHPHRRPGIRRAAVLRAPLAVQELLHVGQEGHELVVVPLLEDAALDLQIVLHLAPRRSLAHVAQHLPRPLLRPQRTRPRQQPQRPQQGEAEMLHRRLGSGLGHDVSPFASRVLVRAV